MMKIIPEMHRAHLMRLRKANLISHIIVEALTTERMIHSGTKSNMHLDKLTTIAKPRMIP
jgi:hypothetical protein